MTAWQTHVPVFASMKGDRLTGDITYGVAIGHHPQTLDVSQHSLFTSGKS